MPRCGITLVLKLKTMTKHLFLLSCAVFTTAAWSQTLTLREAIASAKQSRPAVRAAQLELDRARRAARAEGSYPATLLGLGTSSRPDLGATDQDLYLSQPLDLFGRTGALQQRGKAAVQVGQANYRQALLELQSDVLRRYFEAAVALRFEQVASDLLVLAESLYKAADRRFEEGQIPEVQRTRAKIELDLATQASALRSAQRRAAEKRLAAAIGFPKITEPLESTAVLPTLEKYSTNQRPDLLLYAAQAQVADAEANIARRSGLPELELQGLRSPWRGSSSTYGARLQLTVPLFDHGRRRFEADAARLQAAAARAQLDDARKLAEAQLDAIEIERESAVQRVVSYESIQLVARDLVGKSQRGYTQGIGTLLDVLEATRALREIEQQLAEARLALSLIEIERYEAAGVLLEEVN